MCSARRSDAEVGQTAFRLAQFLGAQIEASNVTIDIGATALANVLAAVLFRLTDDEFEQAMAMFADAVRMNRLVMQKPAELN